MNRDPRYKSVPFRVGGCVCKSAPDDLDGGINESGALDAEDGGG